MVGVCLLVVHYWADLQLIHGFHCYDNIAPNAKWQQVLYSLYSWLLLGVGAWLSGNALVSINEVTLRWAWLVLEWVTICGQVNHLGL